MGSYVAVLALLTVPFVQDQLIYLNKVKLTWGTGVNFPEK